MVFVSETAGKTENGISLSGLSSMSMLAMFASQPAVPPDEKHVQPPLDSLVGKT